MQEHKIQPSDRVHELVSALADGELQGAELDEALDLLRSSAQGRASWYNYHLVGDVLRSGPRVALGAKDEVFMARLRLRLQEEGAPARQPAIPAAQDRRRSANDSVWGWKLVAGLGAMAMVGVVGWQLLMAPQAVQMAQPEPSLPQPVLAEAQAPAPLMIRDPRLDQLITAHQQQGGASALQMPAGFLRNATFERPAR